MEALQSQELTECEKVLTDSQKKLLTTRRDEAKTASNRPEPSDEAPAAPKRASMKGSK